MNLFKKSLVLSAAFACMTAAHATVNRDFEILEVKAPEVHSFKDFYRNTIQDMVMYEKDPQSRCSEDRRYAFPVLLNEVEDDFKTLIKEFVTLYNNNPNEAFEKLYPSNSFAQFPEQRDSRKADFDQNYKMISDAEQEGITTRILSSKYFKSAKDPVDYTKVDLVDLTTITAEQFCEFLGRYEYRYLNVLANPKTTYDDIHFCDINGFFNKMFLIVHASKYPQEIREKASSGTCLQRFMERSTCPENPAERPAWHIGRTLSIFTQDLMKNIFRTAKNIYTATRPEDNLIIFGNTPYYIGRALKLYMEDQPEKRRVIEFPFSGNPNRGRSGNCQNSDIIVTESRLNHLKERMNALGFFSPDFYKDDNLTVFIDVIGLGGGICYTLDVMVDTLSKAGHSPQKLLKNVRILSLNQFNTQCDDRHEKILGKETVLTGSTKLTLPNLENPRYRILCHVFFTPGHGILDNCVDQDYHLLRGFPKYSPGFWNHDYDFLLNKEDIPNRKILLEHFDSNIRSYIAEERK